MGQRPKRDNSDLLGSDEEITVPIPATCDSGELATLLGLTRRHVNMLTSRDVLTRTDKGRFNTRDSVTAYCAYARRSKGADLDAATLRLKTEQADKIELANAAARREMVPAAAVKRAWVGTAHDLRAALLAVPARVTANLGLDRAAAVDLDAEIRLALETIAEAPAVAESDGDDL